MIATTVLVVLSGTFHTVIRHELLQPGYALRFVVLSTGKPIMLMFAYIYDTGFAGNLLQDWQLINSKLKSSRHRIDSLEAVG